MTDRGDILYRHTLKSAAEIQFDMQKKKKLCRKPKASSIGHLRGEEGERSLDQQTHQPLRVEDELVTAGLLVSDAEKKTNKQ